MSVSHENFSHYVIFNNIIFAKKCNFQKIFMSQPHESVVQKLEVVLFCNIKTYFYFYQDHNSDWSFWNVRYVSTIPDFGDFWRFSPAFSVFRKIFVFTLPLGPIDPPVPGWLLTTFLMLFRSDLSDILKDHLDRECG